MNKRVKNLKIGNLSLETYPLSQCNLKATENMVIYPLQGCIEACPICGRKLHNNFVMAVQIAKSRCVKINGSACRSCNTFFTISSKLIDWLKIKKYNKGVPKIIDTYNINFHASRCKDIFYGLESVFVQFLLMSEQNATAFFVTYEKNDENHNNGIIYYENQLAFLLLKAEKDDNRHIVVNNIKYTIVKIKRKPIKNEEIDSRIQSYLEKQISLSDGLPLVSYTTIVYVYRGDIECYSSHTTEEVRLNLTNLSDDLRDFCFYAVYCYDCRKYLMKYSDYEACLKRFKLFPLAVELCNSKRNFDMFNRAEQSPLRLNGYTTRADVGLSSTERHRVLKYIVDHGILSKRKAIDYLEYFITQNSNNKRFWLAVQKWQEDKEFLLGYSEHPVPLIAVGKVERLKK